MAKSPIDRYGIVTLLHNEFKNELEKVANIYDASDQLVEEYKTFPNSEAGDVTLLRRFNYENGELLGESVSVVAWTDALENAANPSGPAITDISLSSEEVLDGSLTGTVVATISTAGGTSPITYTIVNDPSDKFTISGDQLVLDNTADIADVSYAVGIKATDFDGNTFSKGFTIAVTPVITFANDYSTVLNGTDEYINVTHDASLDFTTGFTASAWIKMDVGSIGPSPRTVLSKWENLGDERAILIRVLNTGNVELIVNDDGTSGTNYFLTSIGTIAEDAWYHVACTFSSGTAKIYINGAEDISGSSGFTAINSTTEPIRFGSVSLNGAASQLVEGKIDELSLYDQALSPAEIYDVYNGGEPADLNDLASEPDMVMWLRMGDDDTVPVFTDNSSNTNDGLGVGIDGTNLSSDVPEAPAVYVNQNSVSFDGVSQYLNVGTPADIKTSRFDPISISVWAKRDTTSSVQTIISYSDNAVSSGMALFFESDSSNVLRFVLASSLIKLIDVESTLGAGITGAWHHILLTYDGSSSASGVTIYLDGVEAAKTINDDSLTGSIGNVNPVHIGSFADTTSFFDGNLDELSTYDDELGSSDAIELFNLGVPGDISSMASSPDLTHWYRMGEGSTYPVVHDAEGTFDSLMINMTTGNITTDVPS